MGAIQMKNTPRSTNRRGALGNTMEKSHGQSIWISIWADEEGILEDKEEGNMVEIVRL